MCERQGMSFSLVIGALENALLIQEGEGEQRTTPPFLPLPSERLSKKEGGVAVCCYAYAMNNAMMRQIM